MNAFPLFTATLRAFVVGTSALFAQTKPAPDTTQLPRPSSVVIRQSGAGNSATITQSGGGKATTIVTTTGNGNTTTVRHDGQSSVHVEQTAPAQPPRPPKPEPDKPKPH